MKRRIMYAVVVVLLICGGYCGWRYYLDVIQPEQQIAEQDDKQNRIFEKIKPDITVYDHVSEETESKTGTAVSEMLAPAEEVNKSTNAWLTIPGTHIDYPVVQGEDNDFYLHHGFDGELNQELGCPFLDCRCNSDYSGFNSIVYAHHMTMQRMFADIALFKEEDFFRGHDKGYLILNDEVHTVQFFAYLNVPSSAELYKTDFASDEDKLAYLDYIKENAGYYSDIEMNEKSRLLLLSTCTYEYEEARGVLVGLIV